MYLRRIFLALLMPALVAMGFAACGGGSHPVLVPAPTPNATTGIAIVEVLYTNFQTAGQNIVVTQLGPLPTPPAPVSTAYPSVIASTNGGGNVTFVDLPGYYCWSPFSPYNMAYQNCGTVTVGTTLMIDLQSNLPPPH